MERSKQRQTKRREPGKRIPDDQLARICGGMDYVEGGGGEVCPPPLAGWDPPGPC